MAGIVLTDAAGLPRAILPKGVLFEALAAAPTQRDWPQSQDGAKGVIERNQDELMVRRYGRLDFPAEAGLGVPLYADHHHPPGG